MARYFTLLGTLSIVLVGVALFSIQPTFADLGSIVDIPAPTATPTATPDPTPTPTPAATATPTAPSVIPDTAVSSPYLLLLAGGILMAISITQIRATRQRS